MWLLVAKQFWDIFGKQTKNKTKTLQPQKLQVKETWNKQTEKKPQNSGEKELMDEKQD